MKLTNQEIYQNACSLQVFDNCNIKIPVKINFYLQKNIQLIKQAAMEIDQARLGLAAQYGSLNDMKDGYHIPSENIEEINKELNDLFAIEQDINIHIFKLGDFENLELEYQQMSAIMFMIEE